MSIQTVQMQSLIPTGPDKASVERMRMAMALMAKGGGPYRHPMQGVGDGLSKIAGAWQARQEKQKQDEQKASIADTMQRAVTAGRSGTQWKPPEDVYSLDGKRVAEAGKPAFGSGYAPGTDAMAAVLAANPETAMAALQMQQNAMLQRERAAAARETLKEQRGYDEAQWERKQQAERDEWVRRHGITHEAALELQRLRNAGRGAGTSFEVGPDGTIRVNVGGPGGRPVYEDPAPGGAPPPGAPFAGGGGAPPPGAPFAGGGGAPPPGAPFAGEAAPVSGRYSEGAPAPAPAPAGAGGAQVASYDFNTGLGEVFGPGFGQLPRSQRTPLDSTGARRVSEAMQETVTNLRLLREAEAKFDPAQLTYQGRAAQMWGSALDRINPGLLKPEERARYERFLDLKSNAGKYFSLTLKALSGAAVTEAEMKRSERWLPNVGDGLFDGDSPTEFGRKMQNALSTMESAYFRMATAISQGVPLDTAAADLPLSIVSADGRTVWLSDYVQARQRAATEAGGVLNPIDIMQGWKTGVDAQRKGLFK